MFGSTKKLLMIGLDGAIPEHVLKFSEEGTIPNISKVLKNGFFSKAISSPPCDTPTNWTTIVTGAWTGTHGIASFAIHLKGESFNESPHNSSNTDFCRAEFIWDVAERYNKKVLIFNFRPSWPPTIKNGIIVPSAPRPMPTNLLRRELSYPPEISEELIKNVFKERKGAEEFEVPPHEISDEEFIQNSLNSNMYHADCVEYLKQKYNWDILIYHNHTPDSLNHRYINDIWSKFPNYDIKKAKKAWEIYSKVWNDLDKMVGRIINECGDEETTTILLSDHGCMPSSKLIWAGNTLRRSGLLNYKWDDNAEKYILDIKNSKVVLNSRQKEYIWVNLIGREPDGIVKPEEYEKVREQIIQALYSIRDPETGECPIALAGRKEDLEFLGQWGDRCADVIFYVKPGYHLRGPTDDIIERLLGMGDVGGIPDMPPDHGGYLPNAVDESSSDMAFLLISGPGIRKNYKRARPVNLVDVAPTMAYLLGMRPPAQAEGKIIADALDL